MASVGFIGLGNVGGKLAGSLLRNGIDLAVRDLDRDVAQPFLDGGAAWGETPNAMAETCDVIITCLPSPAASAAVLWACAVAPHAHTVRPSCSTGSYTAHATGTGPRPSLGVIDRGGPKWRATCDVVSFAC